MVDELLATTDIDLPILHVLYAASLHVVCRRVGRQYLHVALATKDSISLQTESGIKKNVVKRFLDGCDWSKMTETRIMTHKGWTNMFATRNANFEQSNIDTFLSFVDEMSCSADSYVSLSGSNGCADQLTNWDGSKKPGLAAPEKKKGGGMSR